MKAPALIAALIIVAGMPDVTFAQTRKSSASPQDLLRRVFELVAMDDLTNAAAVETLNVPDASPPVPHVSTSASRASG